MSAWIVSKTHIDLLVTAGLEYRGHHDWLSWWHEGSGKRYQLLHNLRHDVGQMLWAENLASVASRYPDDDDGERPGPIDFRDADVLTYRHEEVPGLNHVAQRVHGIAVVAKAISCYEYQSCEHDGWKTSQARAFCESLRDACLNQLPGYDKAPWGFDNRNYVINGNVMEDNE